MVNSPDGLASTPTASTRISSNSTPWATTQRIANRRSRFSFVRLMDSSGAPNRSSVRVLTSQTTSTRRSTATMSISPSAHRQFRSITRNPDCCRYSAARSSPCRPRTSLAFIWHHLRFRRCRFGEAGAGRVCGLWTEPTHGRIVDNEGGNVGRLCYWVTAAASAGRPTAKRAAVRRSPGPKRSGEALVLFVGELEVTLGELFDVHVLEGDDTHVLDEPGRAVHVPHPGVLHGDFEVDLAVVRRADVELHLVGQVEAPLRLDHVREQTHDVPVLAVELELHLGLVFLEILRAHARPSCLTCTGAHGPAMRSTIGPFSFISGGSARRSAPSPPSLR